MATLEEKYKQLEQKKARLQQTQARLKLQERKAKISQYIKLGQLIVSANLSHLDEATLLGALISLKCFLEDSHTLTEWKKLGDKASQKSTATSEDLKLLEISFKKDLSADVRKQLRAQGFKFNSLRNVWEGKGSEINLQTLIGSHKGTFKEIKF